MYGGPCGSVRCPHLGPLLRHHDEAVVVDQVTVQVLQATSGKHSFFKQNYMTTVHLNVLFQNMLCMIRQSDTGRAVDSY